MHGLGRVGVLGMCVSPQYGGRGFSQQQYCRIMEVIGAHCGGTTVFVNAHHSIGLRAIELFGTKEQKDRWLPPCCTGETLAAFALTEVEAGSDASNVRTTATPTPDGRGYTLNGGKRYITNGAIAGMLTVMARTPDPKEPDGKVTAFIVTPDMPGFEVLEERMDKVGIRGTATGRLAFNNMFVPKENILGQIGKGLRLALTVLDFGRTTFGASCTGSAKFCVQEAVRYANERRQFGQTLGQFELVREKIALAAAEAYAMESATYHTAALIDTGAEDYMLETSMIKLFASDSLWRIVNDTLQIHGGAGFFTDRPWERMMRDARLNLIGEGANDVLRCFNCMVGLRNVGKELQEILKRPWRVVGLWKTAPAIPVKHSVLQSPAGTLVEADRPIRPGLQQCTHQVSREHHRSRVRPGPDRRPGDGAVSHELRLLAPHGPALERQDRRSDAAKRAADRALLSADRLPPQRPAVRGAQVERRRRPEPDGRSVARQVRRASPGIPAPEDSPMTTHDTAFQFSAANIRFGAGITREVGDDLVDLAARRTMVVIDPASCGTRQRVRPCSRRSRRHAVDFEVFDHVVVEPTDASFQEAAAAARAR